MPVYSSISHINNFFAGFRGARRDVLMGDVGQPPHVREDGDMAPDADGAGDSDAWHAA